MTSQNEQASWLAYARLCRIPNVFTALADIGMGLAFVQTPLRKAWLAALTLGAASALLYTAGMVLNDVFDIDVDRRERPQRPLPSGQIDWNWARRLGYLLLGGGVALSWLAGFLPAQSAEIPWRSGCVGTVIAVFVVLYDGVLKKTWLGPLGMGACRFGNVLLGMSLAADASGGHWATLHYEPSQLFAAAGIGAYIVGVTWFARTEAVTSQRPPLILAIAVMAGGIILLSMFPNHAQAYGKVRLAVPILWPVLLAALFLPIVRRASAAVMYPEPQRVQGTVRLCIQSLILFDAAVAVSVGHPLWGVGIIVLLGPMLLLGRRVYST